MNYSLEWSMKMSSLLNNPNLKKRKDPLDRGNDISPQKTFTLDDLKEINDKLPTNDNNGKRITFYSNVRINNHIKNKAEALSSIGLYKSQKEAIDEALDYLIDSLPSEDKRRLKFQIETLEERDVRMKGNKNT